MRELQKSGWNEVAQMKTIYIDADFKCHVANDGTMAAVETDFFDGCCDAYIEGYRYIPDGENWTRSDGEVFHGEMVSPWKPYAELDNAQREYEKALIVDMQNALNNLGVTLDE